MSQKYPNLFLEGNANGFFKADGSRRISQEEIERQIYRHFLKHFTYAETRWRCIVKMNGKKIFNWRKEHLSQWSKSLGLKFQVTDPDPHASVKIKIKKNFT